MNTMGLLADHPYAIPTLVTWFRAQWPEYFAGWSQAEMAQSLLAEASRGGLPCRLVAFASDELAGTIVLRTQGSETPAEFQPELGGLYVVAAHRGHGIGTALVQAGMELAHHQGYATIYATTVTAAGILERLGWQFVQTVVHSDGPLSLYRCTV